MSLTAVLALVALSALGTLDGATTDITANWMPSVKVVEGINTNASDFRIQEYRHIASTDPTMSGDALTAFNAAGKSLDELIKINLEGSADARYTADSTYADSRLLIIVVSLFTVLFGMSLTLSVGRIIAAPIHRTADVLRHLAGGGLDRRVGPTNQDEVPEQGAVPSAGQDPDEVVALLGDVEVVAGGDK